MDKLEQFDNRMRQASILMYAVATGLILILTNLSGWNDGFNRGWLNLLSPFGIASLLLVWLFPWHRYHRNVFLTMTASSLTLAALAVYLTGGLTSPFDVYFLLVVVFAALYYSRRLALFVGGVATLTSLLPLLYSDPVPGSWIRRLVMASACMATSWVGTLMAAELGRRERARQGLESHLKEVRELRDELARANELERRRVDSLLALQRSGASVYGYRETRAAIHGILTEMVRSLGYEMVSVYQREGDWLVMTDQLGYHQVLERIPKGTGVMWRSLLSGESILLSDLTQDPEAVTAFDGIISEVCIPLRLDGMVVGVVNVESTTTCFDATDLEVLELFAQQASGALANARAGQMQDRRERRAVAASKLLARLNTNLLVEEVLRAATEGPVEDYGSAHACVWLPNRESGGTIKWSLAAGAGREVSAMSLLSSLDTIATQREPAIVSEAQNGLASFAGYPLVRGDEVLGIFGVATREPMDKEDFEFFASFAAQVSLRLDNAYSYNRERRRTVQLETVHDIGREIGAILDPTALYAALVEVLHDRLGHSIVTLFVSDKVHGDLVLAAHAGLEGILPEGSGSVVRVPLGTGIAGHVARTRASYRTGDVSSDPHYNPLGAFHIKSELAVPLIAGDEVVGVLNVESESLNEFDETDVTTLEAVADVAAVSLQNARAHALLAQKATTDSLTGLYNHRALIERLDDEIARARRYEHGLSVLFFDIDHFKQVNDTYGHQVGDVVLQEIARLASESLRMVDTLGRYGGEEFVAVLPQTDGAEALRAAERLRATVAGHTFHVDGGVRLGATVSIGMVTYGPGEISRPALLRAADNALYRAKRRGRNRVCRLENEGLFEKIEVEPIPTLPVA